MRPILAILAVLAASLLGPAPARAALDVKVDIAAQRMSVTTSDGERYDWAISSGRQGFRSPNGVYRPTRLEKSWYSRKYGGAMPYSVFFRGGYAIHGTTAVGQLGRPASHGCIRLHPANAAKLFALVRKHGAGQTRIALHGTAPDGLSQFARAAASPKARLAKASAPSKATFAKAPASAKSKLVQAPASSKGKLAKAGSKPGSVAAVAQRQAPGWEAARGQLLLRPALPAGAYGYQPYLTGPRWR